MAKKNAQTWEYKGKTYRMVGKNEKKTEYGYVGYTVERYNVLQVKLTEPYEILKNCSFWKDVEKEHIPNHAIISIGALGYTDWKSQLFHKCRQEFGMA